MGNDERRQFLRGWIAGAAMLVLLAAPLGAWAQEGEVSGGEYSDGAEEVESVGEEPYDWNAIALKGVVSIASEDEASGSGRGTEVLGGFMLSYLRVLVKDLLAVEIAMHLYFGQHAIESPIDVLLKLLWPLGDWELSLGLGFSLSARFPWLEGEEKETYAGGTASLTAVYFFRERLGLETALDFNYYPADARKFEVAPNIGFVVAF